jgi:hypothetical protein
VARAQHHDGVDELVRVVDREQNGTVVGDVLAADHLDVSKEDAEDGVEEHLDGEVQVILDVAYENVRHYRDAHDGDVDLRNSREHMKEEFDRVDPAIVVGKD